MQSHCLKRLHVKSLWELTSRILLWFRGSWHDVASSHPFEEESENPKAGRNLKESSTFSTSGINQNTDFSHLLSLHHLNEIPWHYDRNIMCKTTRRLSQGLFCLYHLKQGCTLKCYLYRLIGWPKWGEEASSRLIGSGGDWGDWERAPCMVGWPLLIVKTPDGPNNTCIKGPWLAVDNV